MSSAFVEPRVTDLLDSLAGVISYPGPDYEEVVDRACHRAADQKEIATLMESFRNEIAGLSGDQIEELFTRTFDLNPVAALDVGWHLWGDAYERGRFLSTVRGWLFEEGIVENGELPDHLTHLLPLLGRLEERRAIELVRYVRSSFEKIRKPFAETDNPYRHVLDAIEGLVDAEFPTTDDISVPGSPSAIGAGHQPYEVKQ